MEDEKKRYKATDIKVEGPFDGWIIEEMTDDELEKEAAKQAETQAQVKKTAAPQGAGQSKLSPEELEKKRNEQLNKIKDLINQKRKAKQEAAAKAPAPEVNKEVSAPVPKPAEPSPEDLEAMLQKKSKETGIPVEVLRMIEEKKKELRQRKANGDGEKKTKPAGGGVEMYDTVKERREREEAEKYYAERQERQVVKKKVPNGEELGDRVSLGEEEKSHDLYNVMDDVGLDDDER